jgi:acyl-CoA hydrolase
METLDDQNLDIARFVRPGDRVVCGQGTAEPLTLAEALVSQAAAIGPFSLFLGVGFSQSFGADAPETIAFSSYGAMGTMLGLSRTGRLQVDPIPYGALTRSFADRSRRADVVFLQLARKPDGRLNMGMAWDYTIEAARHARTVIAEIMDDLPLSAGGDLPDDFRVDAVLHSRRRPCEPPAAKASEAAARIGRNVAGIIPDGAVLQIGVGSLPDAILNELTGHRRLGLHSGVASDAVVALVERGAMDNSSKPFDTGVAVCGSLFGSGRLRRFADRNTGLRLESALYTHDFGRLASIPGMTALNSVLEVDLLGQANSELLNGMPVGGIGGQGEFAAGAMASQGGRSILSLNATAAGGRVSRVVPRVAKVSAAADTADVLVTEFGAADVRGIHGAERARRIISIAAPAFREDLERALHENGGEP